MAATEETQRLTADEIYDAAAAGGRDVFETEQEEPERKAACLHFVPFGRTANVQQQLPTDGGPICERAPSTKPLARFTSIAAASPWLEVSDLPRPVLALGSRRGRWRGGCSPPSTSMNAWS